MFQIAMIEDEEHTRQEVERLISREFEKLKVQDITTEIYKTAEEFLEVKKHYDVVISDIDLPGKSGIDLGRILKAEQKDICLVFLTSYAEFAVDSYVLEAYQYILKRDMKERLPAVLQKIYQEKQKESQNFFWIGGVTDQRKLYHKDIICIRKVKGQKYVEFVMVNGAYKERLALHQIFEDLKSPAFIFAGRSYINHPMELNIWRAPTDNDMYIKLEWEKAHYDAAYTRAYRIEVLQNKHGVLIMEHLAVVADTVQKILDVEMTWKINEDGKIEAVIEAVKDKEFPDLPRFGIRMFLNKKMDEITYFGMGPQESYRDKHQASCHGLFRSKVAQMHEDYIRPQENGSHYDCDYVEITNGQCGIAAVSKNPFSFNASVYTQEELERVSHNYELKESDSTVFCMDYAMNGIGSNSCGPDVMDKYRFDEEAFQFQFELIPFVKG